MTRRKPLLTSITALAVAGALGLAAHAGPTGDRGGHGHGSAGESAQEERGMGGGMMGPGMMGPGMHERGMRAGPEGKGHPGMMMHRMAMRAMHGFPKPRDADDAQREAIRSLNSEIRGTLAPLMAEALDHRDRLRDEMHAERPDPAAARRHHDALAEVHGRMIEAWLAARNDYRELLTEEQREQARERMREHMH